MAIPDSIVLRIAKGQGYKVAMALYGRLRDKVGNADIGEIPEIEDYLQTVYLVGQSDGEESHEVLTDWIDWILEYLSDESLDFIADDTALEEAYYMSAYTTVEPDEGALL